MQRSWGLGQGQSNSGFQCFVSYYFAAVGYGLSPHKQQLEITAKRQQRCQTTGAAVLWLLHVVRQYWNITVRTKVCQCAWGIKQIREKEAAKREGLVMITLSKYTSHITCTSQCFQRNHIMFLQTVNIEPMLGSGLKNAWRHSQSAQPW